MSDVVVTARGTRFGRSTSSRPKVASLVPRIVLFVTHAHLVLSSCLNTQTHTQTHTQLVLYLQLFVGRHSQARYAIGGIGTSGLVGILLVSSLGHLLQLDSCCQGVQAIASGPIDLHASGSQCPGGIWCDWAHVSVRIAVSIIVFEQIIKVFSQKGCLLPYSVGLRPKFCPMVYRVFCSRSCGSTLKKLSLERSKNRQYVNSKANCLSYIKKDICIWIPSNMDLHLLLHHLV